MSVEAFVVDAESRSDEGKGASRRLRHTGKFPAVIYGGSKEPKSITLSQNVMSQQLENEAFYSHILDINVDGEKESAILKDIQWHPYKPIVMHVDFLRVDENTIIKVQVPIHCIGADVAPGVKEGGIVTHQMTSVEVSCPAGKLPEFIEVDISSLELGGTVHLSELKVPADVSIVELSHGEDHDQTVASIVVTRGAVETEETDVAEGEEEAPAAE